MEPASKSIKTYSCGHSLPLPRMPFVEHIDETWQTLGGSVIRVRRCFHCRNLVPPIEGKL